MKTELNSLDLEIKRMMLEYPSLFPTRLHAMSHLFCTHGNGYEWYPDGTLKDCDNKPMPDHIVKSERRDIGLSSSELDEYEDLRLEYEGLVRGFREKHIDHLCQTDYTDFGETLSFFSVYPMSWDYCAMGKAAARPELIADDWRDGIREFVYWYLAEVNGYYGCWDDALATEPGVDLIGDARTRTNYIICQTVLKTMKTDEDRKADKLRMKLHRKLMWEIKQEK